MKYVVLYWGVMVIGYFFGSKFRNIKENFFWVSIIQMIFISVLVFLMGLRMGCNDEVIANIGSIGLEALFITVVLMAGSVIAISVTRRFFNMDKYALNKIDILEHGKYDNYDNKEETGEEKTGSNLITYLIIVFVILGVFCGYFFVDKIFGDLTYFNEITGELMVIGLALMLHVIGFDMGLSGTVVKNFSKVGIKVIAFPIAVLVGTTAAALLLALILPLGVKESLAIAYGFGWYTFAPVAIANQGYVIASAISFMHNVIRELGGVILAPMLAKKIGYIEVASLPGVAGMDILIPIIEKATRQDIIVYSFAIGTMESLLVPLLVPLVIGL